MGKISSCQYSDGLLIPVPPLSPSSKTGKCLVQKCSFDAGMDPWDVSRVPSKLAALFSNTRAWAKANHALISTPSVVRVSPIRAAVTPVVTKPTRGATY